MTQGIPERAVDNLLGEAARFLAWQSIGEDARELNLDPTQVSQVKETREKSDRAVQAQVEDAYQWTLSPTQEGTNPIRWEALIARAGGFDTVGGIARRASSKLQSAEHLILKWSPVHLKRELDRWFWKPGEAGGPQHIGVGQLWEYFATYIYLPRLRDATVLLETVKSGRRLA